MRHFIAGYIALLTLFAAIAAAGAIAFYDREGPSSSAESYADRYSFNVARWEIRHFPEKWLYKIGGLFQDRSGDGGDALREYFALIDDLSRLQQEGPSAELDAAEEKRAKLENRAEDIIEGRVTSVLEDQGLTMGPPPFSDLDVVFPPVDFELDSPPRVLAVSPRDRIELRRSDLLTPGLSLATAIGIEDGVEGDDSSVSALVVNTGGVATYPSVISDLRSYDSLVDTVFHEWLHHYLAFFPLGAGYFSGSELRTLNESVANIGGRELAALYFARYGPLELAASPAPATPSPSPAPSATAAPFDFTREMRALRVQVEALLADGQITQAEQLMDDKRDEFEAEGVYIRRLNQAYFAFYGFYGDTAASIDPIGPKLQTLLERAGSPGAFIREARAITSEQDLDALLDER